MLQQFRKCLLLLLWAGCSWGLVMRFPEIARGIAAATLFTLIASSAAIARQGAWQVSRVTGEVWIASAGAQKVSLTSASVVQAGDSIRTGRNGRVLLVRGEEVIMIAPGS